MMHRPRLLLVVAAVLATGACDRASAAGSATAFEQRDTTHPAPVPAHVDSALPLEELLRRFRADLSDTPAVLRHGERSRDALARRFVRAVATHDTAALDAMILSRAEFAWLYYPAHPLTRPPYALDAAMMWMQMRVGSETGIGRVLQRHGGRSLGYEGIGCRGEPQRFGGNTVWSWCTIQLREDAGPAQSLGLFGSIVERAGTYKFVSYENKL